MSTQPEPQTGGTLWKRLPFMILAYFSNIQASVASSADFRIGPNVPKLYERSLSESGFEFSFAILLEACVTTESHRIALNLHFLSWKIGIIQVLIPA